MLQYQALHSVRSTRTPNSSKFSNTVDKIEFNYQQNNLSRWGFVIYRGTYSNDAEWAECLSRLQHRMRESLSTHNGTDLLDTFALTVIEDAARFDGASTATVREDFQRWATEDRRDQLEQQQQQQETTDTPPAVTIDVNNDTKPTKRDPRHNFCIYIDSVSLSSIIHDAAPPEEPDATADGWVKLLVRDWALTTKYEAQPDDAEDDGEDREPIEGSRFHDVGWMKVAYQNVMVEFYQMLSDWNVWAQEYVRPPEVAEA